MAPTTYSGTLAPKKKSELHEISLALRINDQGTKDELVTRIKKHLDLNPDLEDDPTFSGLFVNRRKRSIQPPNPISRSRNIPFETVKPSSSSKSSGRRVTTIDPVRESTPDGDIHDVSMYLKRPISPMDSTPDQSPLPISVVTPSSLPPLPPSPSKGVVERVLSPPSVAIISLRVKDNETLRNSLEVLAYLRKFLSNSQNIWSLTAMIEMLYILKVIVPWRTVRISLAGGDSFLNVTLRYPLWSFFQTYIFWMVILHWAIPSLVIPAIAGSLISFNLQSHLAPPDTPRLVMPFDSLTAAIIRLAAQIGYPFPALDSDVQGLDVIGFRWRVLNASVGLAFAFAEAIAGTPQTFAKSLAIQQQRLFENRTLNESDSVAQNVLMAREPDYE